jgi:hypothetical protein
METIGPREVGHRRRVVLPPEIPPGATVMLHRLTADVWILTLKRRAPNLNIVLIPDVERLLDDPAWERKELQPANALSRHLRPPGC